MMNTMLLLFIKYNSSDDRRKRLRPRYVYHSRHALMKEVILKLQKFEMRPIIMEKLVIRLMLIVNTPEM